MILAGLTILLAGFILGSAPAAGADDEDDDVEIVLTEPLPLEDFLKAVGKVAEFPLYWDPKSRALQSKEVIGARNLKAPRDQLFELVRALLTFYELVLIPVGPEGYQVYLVMDARQTAAIVKLKPKYVDLDEENLGFYESQDGLFLTTTIKVENMSSLRDARTALDRIVTGQNIGNVTEVPAARAFVVTDFAPNVVAVYRLLREMDVQPEGKQVTSAWIPLEHATATEIEPILQDLFTGQDRVTRAPANRRGAATSGASAVDEDPEPRIISDFRTNQLIVYGTHEDIDEIRRVVARLDRRVHIPTTWIHVLPLKNLDAQETATVLGNLIDGSSFFRTDEPGAGTSGTAGRPGEEAAPSVVADPGSNSLLISGSPRQFEELKRIVARIDVMKSQVLIEAALLELSLDDSYRVAMELGLSDDHGLTQRDAASGFGFTTFGLTEFADKDGDTFFTDRIPTFVDEGGAAPTGIVGGIFALGQIPLIFNLLNTVSQTRLLQLPSIVAADNEKATMRVLERQSTSANTTSNGGNVTGGFGGFEDAGTTLHISPHIADDHYLLLNINLSVSFFIGEPRVVGGALLPADQIERELITAVSVPDRHTVVLGGILGTNQTSTIDRAPILSEIPVLGELFKGTSKRCEQTSLFLFVTPTIMSEPGGLDVLDQESCKRKQKADSLIGATDMFNTTFPACEYQDPATGCLRGSGNASDRLERLGALEQTRFAGVSENRLNAERAARRAALRRSRR